jgi:hypothetical protein
MVFFISVILHDLTDFVASIWYGWQGQVSLRRIVVFVLDRTHNSSVVDSSLSGSTTYSGNQKTLLIRRVETGAMHGVVVKL